MGRIATKKIERSNGALRGVEMARGGIVVGWVGIGLTALGICIGLIIFVVVGMGSGSLSLLEVR